MRIDLKNGATYNLIRESEAKFEKCINGFPLESFYQHPETYKWGMKSHVIIDYGTHKRTIWFENEYDCENFINQYAPLDSYNTVIT